MIDDIQSYQLEWNQHVLRMPENNYHENHCNIDRKEEGIKEDLTVLGKTSSCSCRTGIDYPKLRMEEEEE